MCSATSGAGDRRTAGFDEIHTSYAGPSREVLRPVRRRVVQAAVVSEASARVVMWELLAAVPAHEELKKVRRRTVPVATLAGTPIICFHNACIELNAIHNNLPITHY